MRYVLVPYEPFQLEAGGANNARRSPLHNPALLTPRPTPEPYRNTRGEWSIVGPKLWDDCEVLGQNLLTNLSDALTPGELAQIRAIPGLVSLPELGFTDRLGASVAAGERRQIAQRLEALGYSRAEIAGALGSDDGADASFGELLTTIAKDQRSTRYDPQADAIVETGSRVPVPVIPGFTMAGGAFGDTATLVSNFTGSDAAQPTGWSDSIVTSDGGVQITSNQLAPSASPGSGWYNAATWTEVESYVTWATGTSTSGLYLYARIQSPNTAGIDAYLITWVSGASSMYRMIDGGFSFLVGATPSFSDGVKIGIEVTGVGATVTVRGLYNAGSWVEAATYGDTNAARIVAAGYVGASGVTTHRFDDFFVGDLSGPPPPTWSEWPVIRRSGFYY